MIYTKSSFYYGYKVTAQPYNGYMNIDEGSGPITVEVPVGSYTLNTITDAIRNALLTQATLDYTVTLNRQDRQITITATTPFDLLTQSGANSATSIWPLIGFSTDADLTGELSYTSSIQSGDEYVPQFLLQSYVPPDDLQQANQASKNVAAIGTIVEVIRFGLAKFIEFEIKYITSNLDFCDGYTIEKNPTGLEDARRFLQSITELNEFEFMPDRDNAGDFYRVIVESMPQFSDGTGYRLRELFNENYRDVYTTGIIKLRVIE